MSWQLHQRLQKRADDEGRSLSNLISFLLEAATAQTPTGRRSGIRLGLALRLTGPHLLEAVGLRHTGTHGIDPCQSALLERRKVTGTLSSWWLGHRRGDQ